MPSARSRSASSSFSWVVIWVSLAASSCLSESRFSARAADSVRSCMDCPSVSSSFARRACAWSSKALRSVSTRCRFACNKPAWRCCSWRVSPTLSKSASRACRAFCSRACSASSSSLAATCLGERLALLDQRGLRLLALRLQRQLAGGGGGEGLRLLGLPRGQLLALGVQPGQGVAQGLLRLLPLHHAQGGLLERGLLALDVRLKLAPDCG